MRPVSQLRGVLGLPLEKSGYRASPPRKRQPCLDMAAGLNHAYKPTRRRFPEIKLTVSGMRFDMRMIREATAEEIDQHLKRLGGGNHSDNMTIVSRVKKYSLVELSEEDFSQLVFLQSDAVIRICPRGGNRCLYEVAFRALEVAEPRQLGPDWNLEEIVQKTAEFLAGQRPAETLLIREATQGEKQFGPWYLQDGSHRALGYAMAIVGSGIPYEPWLAYSCAEEATL